MRSGLLPSSATPAARRLLWTRSLRGFADGVVSVLLADYLIRLGFTPTEVGVVVTATLLGSAALTIAVGLSAHRLDRRLILLGASALMLLTGLLFAGMRSFCQIIVSDCVWTLTQPARHEYVHLPPQPPL